MVDADPMSTVYQYPLISLYGDYIRAVCGAAFCGLPLLFVNGSPILSTILAAVFLLFVGFGAKTAIRHLTLIEIDDIGIIAKGPLGRRIAWRDIDKVVLKYYSTQRDKNEGWMHLSLFNGKQKLTVESTLSGFDDVVGPALQAGFKNDAAMDETTLENITALGISVDLADEA
ncbi:MAG: hypothetical protein ACJAU6_000335 [Alphaproteobacteria bacterium]|jgi:hypothetical protein